jgi:hypothetical protein
MELYCTPKSQHTTVKHSQQRFEHTYMSNLYGLWTLTQSSNQKESVACLHVTISKHNWLNQSKSEDDNPVTVETFPCPLSRA